MPHWIGIDECVRASFAKTNNEDTARFNTGQTYRVQKKSPIVSARKSNLLMGIAERIIRCSTFVHCCGLASLEFSQLQESPKTVSVQDADTSEDNQGDTEEPESEEEKNTEESDDRKSDEKAQITNVEKYEKADPAAEYNPKKYAEKVEAEEETNLDLSTATIDALGGHGGHNDSFANQTAVPAACYRQTVCNCVCIDQFYEEALLSTTSLHKVAGLMPESICHQNLPALVNKLAVIAGLVVVAVLSGPVSCLVNPIFVSPRQSKQNMRLLFATATAELNWDDLDTRSAPSAPSEVLESVVAHRRLCGSRRLRRRRFDLFGLPYSEVTPFSVAYTLVSACRLEVDHRIATVACFSIPFVCYPLLDYDEEFALSGFTDAVPCIFLGRVGETSGKYCLRLLEETRFCMEEEVIDYL